jgi:hypothetical protein
MTLVSREFVFADFQKTVVYGYLFSHFSMKSYLLCQMLINLIPILTNASLIGYYYDSSLVLAARAVNNKHINSTYLWQTKSNSVLISCHSNPNTMDKFFVAKVTLGVQ